jgi:hypothetical protein
MLHLLYVTAPTKTKNRNVKEQSHFACYLHFKNSLTSLSASSTLLPCFFLWDLQNTNTGYTAGSTAGDSKV